MLKTTENSIPGQATGDFLTQLNQLRVRGGSYLLRGLSRGLSLLFFLKIGSVTLSENYRSVIPPTGILRSWEAVPTLPKSHNTLWTGCPSTQVLKGTQTSFVPCMSALVTPHIRSKVCWRPSKQSHCCLPSCRWASAVTSAVIELQANLLSREERKQPSPPSFPSGLQRTAASNSIFRFQDYLDFLQC